jgi:scaffold protein (connect acetoacetyl-CoA thiolase and HMG-CoA synthase)
MAVPRFWREQPQRYRLVGAQCPKCSKTYFPPRPVCPDCRRASVGRMKPRQMSGRGKVLTFTVVHQPADGFELQVPYVIALVELEEGARVMSQIVDVAPDKVETGLPVEACFRRIREDGKSGVIYYGYKFRIVRAKSARPPALDVEARTKTKPSGAKARRLT